MNNNKKIFPSQKGKYIFSSLLDSTNSPANKQYQPAFPDNVNENSVFAHTIVKLLNFTNLLGEK